MMVGTDAIERERLIAFIDLLGYGAVLKGIKLKGHDEIWKIQNVNERAWLFISSFYEKFDALFSPDSFGDLRIISFSDAIFLVLTADGDKGLDYSEIMVFCHKMSELLSICLADYLPLRGGISIGMVKAREDFAISNKNYLAGLAVNQAVKMEENQEWVGISFVPPREVENSEMKQRYCNLLDWLSTQDKTPVYRWDIPTKYGLEATYSIIPSDVGTSTVRITEIRDFEKQRKSPEANKYRGTLQLLWFLEDSNYRGDEDQCMKL